MRTSRKRRIVKRKRRSSLSLSAPFFASSTSCPLFDGRQREPARSVLRLPLSCSGAGSERVNAMQFPRETRVVVVVVAESGLPVPNRWARYARPSPTLPLSLSRAAAARALAFAFSLLLLFPSPSLAHRGGVVLVRSLRPARA